MIKIGYLGTYSAIKTIIPLMGFTVTAFSLILGLAGLSNNVLALPADGTIVADNWAVDHYNVVEDKNSPNKTSSLTEGSSTPMPTPTSDSASPSPASSAQPESKSTDSSSTPAISETAFDWTPWLIGGGVAILVAAGGAFWSMQRIRNRSQRSTKLGA